MRVDWVSADVRHKHVLQSFTCTSPGAAKYDRLLKQKRHPRPWELDTQSYIRALPVRQRPDALTQLGFAADRSLASVVRLCVAEDEQMILQLIGVRQDLRGRGLGGAALDHAVRQAKSVATRLGLDCGLFARVDHRNDHSSHLFASRGFFRTGDVDGGFEFWGLDLSDV